MAFYEDYKSLGRLDDGAFASIFKVKHLKYGYVRALKILNLTIESEADKAYQSFLKECKYLLKIGNGCHPNIIRIYRPELKQNKALVEMDYVNGLTLLKYLQNIKYMPIDEVYKFIHQIGGALAYCHVDNYLDQMSAQEDDLMRDPNDAEKFQISDEKRQALIKKYSVRHNDLHSKNVMRRHYDGNYVLLDFGLAIQNGVPVKSSSTKEGAPEYKSPEKWENLNVDTTQNDIYSFGVLLFEVLTGRTPFFLDPNVYNSAPEKAVNDLREQHLNDAPPAIEPLRKAAYESLHPGQQWKKDYPDWLDKMVSKCLSKNPDDRYVNAKEFMNEFNARIMNQTAVSDGAQLKTVQEALDKKTAECAILKTECVTLTKKLEEAVKSHDGAQSGAATNQEIIAANQRAMEAEQECDVLRVQIDVLNHKLTEIPKGDLQSADPRKPIWDIILWALLGIAIGVIIGVAYYFLSSDKTDDQLSNTQVEMVEEANSSPAVTVDAVD